MDKVNGPTPPQPPALGSSPPPSPSAVQPPEAPDLLDVVRFSLLLYLKNWGDFFFPYFAMGIATGILFSPNIFPANFSTNAGGLVIAQAAAEFLALRVGLPSLVIGGATLLALERFRGERMGLGKALFKGLRRFPSILVATLLLGLLMAAFLAPAIILFELGDWNDSFLLFAVGGAIDVVLFSSLNFYASVIMVEGLGPAASLRRSWQLSRGRRKPLIGVYLAFVILGYVVYIAFNVPVDVSRENVYATVILGALRTAILAPWFAIAGGISYGLVTARASPAIGPRAAAAEATG